MSSTTKPTVKNLGLLALEYARAVEEATQCKHVLQTGYLAWRQYTSNQHTNIERGSKEWDAMMLATKTEYSYLQRAKARERRSKAKLLALASKVEG